LLAAPEDREPVVRKLIEAGGKMVNFYFTTGDHDFLLITETTAQPSDVPSAAATSPAARAPVDRHCRQVRCRGIARSGLARISMLLRQQ
jgi:hypothetical protein